MAFEDMAGLPGCDYDYNDRSWSGASSSSVSDPVVYSGTWTWEYGGHPGDTATVTLTATQFDPNTLLWKYEIRNNDIGPEPVNTIGLSSFLTGGDPGIPVWGQTNSLGWPLAGTPEQEGTTRSWTTRPTAGDGLGVGSTGVFTYKTTELMLTPSVGLADSAGPPGQRHEIEETGGPMDGPAVWPVMDDVPPLQTTYVSVQPREWLNISDLLDRLRLDPAAKAIIDQATTDGVNVIPGPTNSGGAYNPQTKIITIDPRVARTNEASAILLYELLRHKYRKEQLALNNRVEKYTITRDQYATASERLSYKYMVEHHAIAKAAITKGVWAIQMDRFRLVLDPATGDYRDFDRYLAAMKITPPQPAGTRSHYDDFRHTYDEIRADRP